MDAEFRSLLIRMGKDGISYAIQLGVGEQKTFEILDRVRPQYPELVDKIKEFYAQFGISRRLCDETNQLIRKEGFTHLIEFGHAPV